MRVQHRRVERSDIKIQISQQDSHGTVDDSVVAVHEALRLVCVAGVVTGDSERRIRQVQLLTPCDELGCAGAGSCDVGVIWSHALTGGVPLEENLLAWEAEGLGSVVGDGWTAAVAGHVEVLA